jgi:hypothetical protein
MKIYKDYPLASISMAKDESFIDIIRQFSPTEIFECGTYLGTGSTKMLADLNPKRLVTIECSYKNYVQARANLANYSFVECYHGLSVGVDESVNFMNEHKYIFEDDVFVDSETPIEFYTNEVMGMLNNDQAIDGMRENLLDEILPSMADNCPLILLDSAGGIGLLEFRRVKQIMGDKPYTIVLDDTHHVKHYRSKLEIYSDQKFHIVYDNIAHGSLIATYNHKIDVKPVKKQDSVYVVLGRFGDIYMVAKNLKQPSIICCSTRFSQIAKELFPEHEIFEIHPRYCENPIAAGKICEIKFPSKRIVICQQDGQDRQLMTDFRSFQTFQEYYAQF